MKEISSTHIPRLLRTYLKNLNIYLRIPVTQECRVQALGTGTLLTKPYLSYLDPYEANRFGLVLFSLVRISRKLFTSFEH